LPGSFDSLLYLRAGAYIYFFCKAYPNVFLLMPISSFLLVLVLAPVLTPLLIIFDLLCDVLKLYSYSLGSSLRLLDNGIVTAVPGLYYYYCYPNDPLFISAPVLLAPTLFLTFSKIGLIYI
jgi:hypothetical protein